MVKKLLITIVFLMVLVTIGINVLSRKAPDLLREAIETSLHKKVSMKSIEYRFPSSFELRDFRVDETLTPFQGDALFMVSSLTLNVSPFSFSEKALIIDLIEVDGANVFVRQWQGKLMHLLSGVLRSKSPNDSPEEISMSSGGSEQLPLVIHEVRVKNSQFKFMDYDIAPEGFVSSFSKINAKVKNLSLSSMTEPIEYEVDAVLEQGRGQKEAGVRLKGWTVPGAWDTNASAQAIGLYLPYFKGYYAQLTQAVIQDGYLDARVSLKIQNNDLTLDSDFEIINLLFGDYEAGNQLFGLKADEILSFLKDSSGKLRFQITASWNIADRSLKAKDVIRRSIENSLKRTVLGNVGNVLANTLQKINDQGLEKTKSDVETTVKQIKELFKFG